MFKKNIFTSNGLWETGAVILRVAAGLIIFKYGLEIFSTDKMKGYFDWLTNLNFPAPVLWGVDWISDSKKIVTVTFAGGIIQMWNNKAELLKTIN